MEEKEKIVCMGLMLFLLANTASAWNRTLVDPDDNITWSDFGNRSVDVFANAAIQEGSGLGDGVAEMVMVIILAVIVSAFIVAYKQVFGG